MRRVSTSWASGRGAVTRKMGSFGKEDGPLGHRVNVAREPQLCQVVEQAPAEASGPVEPVEIVRGEATAFRGIAAPAPARRDQETPPRRKLPHEELEDGRFRLAMIQISLDHVELVEIGQKGLAAPITSLPLA